MFETSYIPHDDISYVVACSSGVPPEAMHTMSRCVSRLSELGYSMRTIDAPDVNLRFVDAARTLTDRFEVWTPFFKPDLPDHFFSSTRDGLREAARIDYGFTQNHQQIKAMKARWVNLLFGADCERAARFILCWTPDGCETLSKSYPLTGELAQMFEFKPTFSMPVVNLARPNAMERLTAIVEKLKLEPGLHPERFNDYVRSLSNSSLINELNAAGFGPVSVRISPEPSTRDQSA